MQKQKIWTRVSIFIAKKPPIFTDNTNTWIIRHSFQAKWFTVNNNRSIKQGQIFTVTKLHFLNDLNIWKNINAIEKINWHEGSSLTADKI